MCGIWGVFNKDQSSTGKNPEIQQGVYNLAYSKGDDGIKCRLKALDRDAGVGEVSPTRFTVTVACADSQEYEQSYNDQAPFMQGLTGVKYHPNDVILMQNHPLDTQGCTKDPSLTLIVVDNLSGASDDTHAMKKINGKWVDSGLAGQQLELHCH